MKVWSGFKIAMSISLIAGLVFTSALFSVLLYSEASGKPIQVLVENKKGKIDNNPVETDLEANHANPDDPGKEADLKIKPSAMMSVPLVLQNPELPAGCEVTALTMMLLDYGIETNKLELAKEMAYDSTPLVWNSNGTTVKSWGHPNTGYVGDPTRTQKGFGVYHEGLFPLLEKYIPTALDMTGRPFEQLELQISNGIPVVVWTTINYRTNVNWVEWITPKGTLRTTFSMHAVLLTGYDEQYVYVNDPLNSTPNLKIDKQRFIETWELLGKQAISYTKELS